LECTPDPSKPDPTGIPLHQFKRPDEDAAVRFELAGEVFSPRDCLDFVAVFLEGRFRAKAPALGEMVIQSLA
jgi:hypothetical protein